MAYGFEDTLKKNSKQGVVVHIFDPSTPEAEAS